MKKLFVSKLYIAVSLSALVPCLSYAMDLTNNLNSGNTGLKNPVFCINHTYDSNQTWLLSGETIKDINEVSGNPSYVGGDIRIGGCTWNDKYLGYLGLAVDKNAKTYKVTEFSKANQDANLPGSLEEVTITNSGVINGTMVMSSGLSLTNQIRPLEEKQVVFCISSETSQGLAYQLNYNNTVQNISSISGNNYYVSGFLRINGCEQSNTYLGYLGINLNKDNSKERYKISEFNTNGSDKYFGVANLKVNNEGIIIGQLENR